MPNIRQQEAAALRAASSRLSKKQEQLVYGTLIGDSTIRRYPGSGNCYVKSGHGEKQKDYLSYKKSILSNFVLQNEITCLSQAKSTYGGENYYQFVTITHPLFNEIEKVFYRTLAGTRQKIIRYNILERLSAFGLLVWYLDDGTYVSPAKKHGTRIHFNTQNFDLASQKTIKQWFWKTYQIDAKIYEDKRCHKFYICIGADGTRKLMKLFQKFRKEIPVCMHYKIPASY